jgi:ribonucleoside-diphosphate reductase alpha chain
MHHRLAKEFSRIEKQYNSKNELSEDDIYECLKGFKYIVPQGSPMMGIGNDYVNVSLSNKMVQQLAPTHQYIK